MLPWLFKKELNNEWNKSINLPAEKGARSSRTWLVKVLGLLLSLSLLASSGLGMAAAQTLQNEINGGWITQAVDAPTLFAYMTDRSLRLDSANHPHIVFGGDHLYYGYHNGTSWSIETVDPANGVGLFASIALDASDRPHIAYYDALNGALKYAYWNGAAWVIDTLDQYVLAGGVQITGGVNPDRLYRPGGIGVRPRRSPCRDHQPG